MKTFLALALLGLLAVDAACTKQAVAERPAPTRAEPIISAREQQLEDTIAARARRLSYYEWQQGGGR
ncbi:MAG: hypothetical protein NVS3B25_33500 [Hymenobacter sp.]